MNITQKKIAIIGLGYVGLPLAVEIGRHREVVGLDISKKRIQELKIGLDTTRELNKQQLTEANHLKYTNNIEDISDCSIFIVTVPTPIDSAKRPDLRLLKNATQSLSRFLKPGDIVVYESTVYPGCTEEVCVPILEQGSGLAFNEDFFCGYSPERINPGDKVNTLTTIPKITSGSTPKVADEIDALYSSIIKAGTWKTSSLRVAEAAKVIENSQRDLNIAFVNELSVICNRLGIDTYEVLKAASTKWNFLPFRPGMVGGHCIGVDPYYLTHKAEEVGYTPQVILAGRRINDSMARYSAQNLIRQMLRQGIDVARSKVGILGLTFKENCPDIRNTKIVDLIQELESWGVDVVVTDPWADKSEVLRQYGIELQEIGPKNKVDALCVAVGHTEYRKLKPVELLELCSSASPILADLKALYNKEDCETVGFTVFRL